MDRFTYQRLREERPELSLPPWQRLRRTDRHRAKRMTPEELAAKRAAKLLAREPGTTDALQPQKDKIHAYASSLGLTPWKDKRTVDKQF